MRLNILARLYMSGALMIASTLGYAADTQPIGRKLDNAKIMERVQLVGVIAGGSGKISGIAVIKDIQTGRTYAIKTGDNLPGVQHIKLDRVQRELAVFMAEGKEFHVRLAMGGYTQEADDDEDITADLNKADGPGLFEIWSGDKAGEGDEIVKEGARNPERRAADEPKNLIATPMVSGIKDVPVAETSVDLRKDRDGPVVKYLDSLTAPRHDDEQE